MLAKKTNSIRNALNSLPVWCRYPLSAANEATLYQFRRGSMLSQQLNMKPFLIDLVEHRTDVPFSFNFRITENRIFFYFMLHGKISLSVHKGEYITKVSANHFYISHNRPGVLTASGDQGEHVALIVSIDTDWIDHVSSDFDTLRKFVDDFQNLSQYYRVMPHCRMDKQVHQWLREIYTFSTVNRGALDGQLRLYISLALEHYHKLLKNREGMLIYRIKRYLDEHYTDPDLGYFKLSEIFYSTERTLRNQFKIEFHITIHEYYTQLRMQRANHLIDIEKKPIKDVFMEVGYKDESSFRYAYNKYLRKLRY